MTVYIKSVQKRVAIPNLITTYGQKIKENSTYKTWVINKKNNN
ncbi:hypothetical protein [Spiroplasma endosymbiont of 'Nebria riversi']|nr:hypothetical protein [Spiroplasma endosymbiont of 'Nebria riversi']